MKGFITSRPGPEVEHRKSYNRKTWSRGYEKIQTHSISIQFQFNAAKQAFLSFKRSVVVFFLLINVKISTIVGSLLYMSRINFIPSRF